MAGPLNGLRIVELAGLVAGPFCGLLLSDLGAEVIRIDRPGAKVDPSIGPPQTVTGRGRKTIEIDLKSRAGIDLLLELIDRADAVFESFRPGVAERLGIGPEICIGRNSRLVYGRLTGWGQDGPLALNAGHDLNYIALAGLLHHVGPGGQPPVAPLNLAGDIAGGAMMLALGMVSALLYAKTTGHGQIVDAAMIDGAALMMATTREYLEAKVMTLERGTIPSDGTGPLYTVYECSDGHYVSIACVEPQFRDELLRVLELDPAKLPSFDNRANWPELKSVLSNIFLQRTREAWCVLMQSNRQLCFAPVLNLKEAPHHPHNRERGSYIELAGVMQPAPAPRFSVSRPAVPCPPPIRPGQDAQNVLREWLGKNTEEIAVLKAGGALGSPGAQLS